MPISMSDYLISAVRYDLDRARIRRVRVRPMQGDGAGPPMELTRDQFVMVVKAGRSFARLRGERNHRIEPAPVRLFQLGRGSYLRCDTHPWPVDDLAGIPEY
jgi:hypothetical protein